MSYEKYSVHQRPGKKIVVAEADEGLGVALIHIHTSAADRHGQMSPGEVVDRAVELGATDVVITDHNTRRGSELAQNYARDHELEYETTVHSGVEVTAQDADGSYGHILAIGVNGYIKPLQLPEATIDQIYEKGGIAVIAHPDLPNAQSLPWTTVTRLAGRDDGIRLGIEVFNASGETFHRSPITRRHFPSDINLRVRGLYSSTSRLGAAVAGLDAHDRVLDSAVTLYKGENLMEALLTGDTIPVVNGRAFSPGKATKDVFVMGVHRGVNKIRRGLSASL